MQTINNIQDLKDHFGCEQITGIQRSIFKSTECGCIFNETTTGVSVCGYAEGSDAECEPHRLDYPFNITQFYIELQQADDEGVEMWNEWNSMDPDADDDMQSIIDADDKERAADMNATLRDIGGGL